MNLRDSPDILVLSLDTLRRDCLSGDGRTLMPRVGALGEEGVSFDNAFAAAPWTYPSFASVLTGLWPDQHRACANWPEKDVERQLSILRPDVPTMSEMLQQAGYHTVCVQGNSGWGGVGGRFSRGFDEYFTWQCDFRRGRLRRELRAMLDCLLHRSFWRYVHFTLWRLGRRLGIGALPVDGPMKDSATLLRQAERFLKASPPDRPVFCWINLMDMHQPYVAPRRWMSSAAPPGKVRPVHLAPFVYLEDELNDEDREYAHQRYNCVARYLDWRVDDFLQRWPTLRSDRSRLLVVLSDHGEEFWEHGKWSEDPTWYRCGTGHGHTLYNELLRVPLIVHWPGHAVSGRLDRSLVSLVDLLPSLVDLLRLEVDKDGLSGRSFAGSITESAPHVDGARIVYANSLLYGPERRTAITLKDKLIRRDDTGETELFAWSGDDPGEQQNIAVEDEQAGRVRELSAALDEWTAATRGGGEGGSLTEEEQKAMEAQLRDLGYI